MLTRPFYGIILGAWAIGYFPGFPDKDYYGKRIFLKRKLAAFKTAVSSHKYYGIVWKHKFLGYSRRVSWTLHEMKEGLTEMALRDSKYQLALVKFDALKSGMAGDVLIPGLLHPGTRDDLFAFLEGKLELPELQTPQEIRLPFAGGAPSREKRSGSKAKEQLIMQEIEHDLRDPIEQKLFELVSVRFGKDVVLEHWRQVATRHKWREMFKDQLPNPGSVKISGEGDIPHQPSQAEIARELTQQMLEAQTLKSMDMIAREAFPQGYPDDDAPIA